MKAGTITHYIEIPVKIIFSWYPADSLYSEHIEVDCMDWPDNDELGKLIAKDASAIKRACLEALKNA